MTIHDSALSQYRRGFGLRDLHVEPFTWRTALLFWTVGCWVIWGAVAVVVGGG